jgi:predicted 2-oxoglutarate/Fe(II)-dependent dioxygenase YbiX/peroxiredoxin
VTAGPRRPKKQLYKDGPSMPLALGEPAPWFTAPTPSNPQFVFDTAAGRYVLMLFLPATDAAAAGAALQTLAANRALFDDERLSAFVVVRDPATAATARDMQGLRWFLDLDGRVSRLYGTLGADDEEWPMWLLLDPTLRTVGRVQLASAQMIFDHIKGLSAPDQHAGVPLHAPVLIAPRTLEPELCQRLIALHEADGGRFTGVMRDAGDRTLAVMDELKKRRDVLVEDEALRALLHERLQKRLFPLIHRAFSFGVTRIERYVVSCYDAADGAVFHAHRDSTTQATAHRKFACSINLNEGFDGGDLRFAEYGPRTYRPPPGGAVVFSCALLHEATRVTAGRRYAFLPFFYDEASAQVLDAYRARVGATGEPAL